MNNDNGFRRAQQMYDAQEQPLEDEERTIEEELHDIVHDLAMGSGLVCPSCGKTL